MEVNSSENVCEEAVYERLFRSLAPTLRNFLLYKFRDQDTAEDVVQEAFVILWNNCKKVSEALARSYLYKVAQNQMLKKVEKDKVHTRYMQLQVKPMDEMGPDFDLEYHELGKRLQTVIEELPEGQREVFLLNRIDGKTYVEIAEMLDVSVKAVEKRMHKALVALRKVYNKV